MQAQGLRADSVHVVHDRLASYPASSTYSSFVYTSVLPGRSWPPAAVAGRPAQPGWTGTVGRAAGEEEGLRDWRGEGLGDCFDTRAGRGVKAEAHD